MREKETDMTFNEILGDFKANSGATRSSNRGVPLSIWVHADIKARYDKLQEQSKKDFGKRVQLALTKLIELAESRV